MVKTCENLIMLDQNNRVGAATLSSKLSDDLSATHTRVWPALICRNKTFLVKQTVQKHLDLVL